MMKKIISLLIIVFFFTTPTFAHFYWIKTSAKGGMNTPHEIQVYFGEFTSGVYEKTDGDVFQNAKGFTLSIIDTEGNRTQLQTTPKEDHYSASFTPTVEGIYLVILKNDSYKVLDFTQYDYGIFKPQYHSATTVTVGYLHAHTSIDTSQKLILKKYPSTTDTAKFQVLFQGKPIENAKVTVFMRDQWSQKIQTDASGHFTFTMPFNTSYVIEATHEDRTSGVYDTIPYQFTWHCAVYTLN